MALRISIFIISFLFTGYVLATTINIPGDYSTIQEGINNSQSGDTVLVENGTYYENINFRGKNIVVGSRYIIDENLSHINNTIIDGSMSTIADTGSCVVFDSGENPSAVIQGFTLIGGTGTSYDFGGGMVYREGGCIIASASTPTIKNNLIYNNECTIVPGVLGGGGGGISIIYGYAYILNNVIMSNQASYAAGLVLNWSGGIIKNNIVYQNSGGGQYGTAGIMIWYSTPWTATIENNTIVGNISTSTAGGLSVEGTAAYIRNNIIWGNTQQTGQQITGYQSSILEYCNTEESYAGTGNISVNPDFDSTNYQLNASSACIDSGNPAALYNDIEDTNNIGYALFPSLGALRNDIGAYGGPGATILPDYSSITAIKEREYFNLPKSIILHQNYPNPFNLSTTISFELTKSSIVDLRIYDVTGKLVRTLLEKQNLTGKNSVDWNGRNNSGQVVSSGIYYYKINIEYLSEIKRMLLLK